MMLTNCLLGGLLGLLIFSLSKIEMKLEDILKELRSINNREDTKNDK
jgi:hypothetical protein